jgi:hypothetical protein
MDEDMYDEEDDEVMDNNHPPPPNPQNQAGAAAAGNKNKNGDSNKRNGTRLSDQVDMDDEPALVGYERYVKHMLFFCNCWYFHFLIDISVSLFYRTKHVYIYFIQNRNDRSRSIRNCKSVPVFLTRFPIEFQSNASMLTPTTL